MYIAKFEKEDNKTVLYVPVYANTEMEAKNKAITENYIKSRQKRRRILLLDEYAYLSDVIESSFIFVKAPEGPSYW